MERQFFFRSVGSPGLCLQGCTAEAADIPGMQGWELHRIRASQSPVLLQFLAVTFGVRSGFGGLALSPAQDMALSVKHPLLEPQETFLSRAERDPKYFTPFLLIPHPPKNT